MELATVYREAGQDGVRLAATFRPERGDEFCVHFQFPIEARHLVDRESDAFVPIGLAAAMASGESLRIAMPVSSALAGNLDDLQDLFLLSAPTPLSRVRVEGVVPRARPALDAPVAALLFGGGVASWYSLLKHVNIPLPDEAPLSFLAHVTSLSGPRPASVPAWIAEISAATRLEPVCVSSNLATRFPLDWWGTLRPALLASVGLALGGGINRVIVPSARPPDAQGVGGGGLGVLLPRLMSSERIRLAEDGLEAGRMEKIGLVIRPDPLALRNLRVCHHGPDANCGECADCIRTGIELRAAGAEPGELPFVRPWTDAAIDVADTGDPGIRRALEEGLEWLRREGAKSALADRIEAAWRRSEIRLAKAMLKRAGADVPAD